MSIEAIKEALKAGPTAAHNTHFLEDEKWQENTAFAIACNPTAIRELIERLEAAEKDAERYRWLQERHRWASVRSDFDEDGFYKRHRVCWYGAGEWKEAEGQSFDAAIDAAMAGGLAEGVSK